MRINKKCTTGNECNLDKTIASIFLPFNQISFNESAQLQISEFNILQYYIINLLRQCINLLSIIQFKFKTMFLIGFIKYQAKQGTNFYKNYKKYQNS